MGWDISEKGFRIVLSRDVPEVVLRNLGRDVDAFLSDNGLTREDIGSWVIHTGGPKVLEATETALDLRKAHWRLPGNACGVPAIFFSLCFVCFRRSDEESAPRSREPGEFWRPWGRDSAAELVLLRW